MIYFLKQSVSCNRINRFCYRLKFDLISMLSLISIKIPRNISAYFIENTHIEMQNLALCSYLKKNRIIIYRKKSICLKKLITKYFYGKKNSSLAASYKRMKRLCYSLNFDLMYISMLPFSLTKIPQIFPMKQLSYSCPVQHI